MRKSACRRLIIRASSKPLSGAIQELQLGRAVGRDLHPDPRFAGDVAHHQHRRIVLSFAEEKAFGRQPASGEHRLHSGFPLRFGQASRRLVLSRLLVDGDVRAVPHFHPGFVLAAFVFAVIGREDLIVAELVPGHPTALAGAAVLLSAVVTEDQAAHFVAEMVEEDDARRTRFVAFQEFPVEHARMLASLVGDHHAQGSVLFDEVDPLDVDFGEFLLVRSEARQ